MIQQRLPIAAITLHTPHYEQSCLSADKVPFEVPEGWVWCKLEEICHIAGRIGFRGYTKEDLVNKGNGAITLSPSNIIDGEMNYSKCTYISWEKYEESPEIQICNGDILLVKTGSSFGKCAFVRNLPQEATINPQFVAIKYIGCNKEYLTFVLQSQYARNNYDSFVLGTAIPTFTQAALGDMLIPLPPIHEQNNIVKEVKRREVLINIIDCNQEDLASSIEQTKSKILDLAIHGKLVPQDPMDEPAIELLRRINPKFTPCLAADSACDNRQYGKIPKTWLSVPLEALFDVNPKSKLEDKMEVGFVPMELVADGYAGTHSFKSRKWAEVKKGYCHFVNGDIGVAKISPCFENLKSTLFDNLPNGHGAGTTELVIMRNKGIHPKFYLYLFKSNWYITQGTKYFKGVVGQQRVNREIFTTLHVPLPPLAEQQRIVTPVRDKFYKLKSSNCAVFSM